MLTSTRNVLFVLMMLLCLIPVAKAAPPEPTGYIVVLNDEVASPEAAARKIAGQVGGQVGFIYQHALKGFSISMPPQAVAALERNPLVKYVANDDLRYASAQTVPTGVRRIYGDTNPNLAINGSDDYRVDVDVAVIDTGIDFQHPDLNVAGGVKCISSNFFRPATCVDGGDDDHYHGTHVAGTIGALDNGVGVVGVAPGARLWAVKVLNSRGSGYSSWIIAGIDWVTSNAATIEVANMSLGGSGYSQAEYDAIQGAVNKGVAFAVAAGNEDDDANNYSPSAFDNVLCVSAVADFNGQPGGGAVPTCRTDVDDTLADFSNWGPEVDIAAPGVCIQSTFPLEQGEYGTISGTSMASPHAAGALALLASVNNPGNATQVFNLYNQVKSAGNYDFTDDSGDGIKEPLLDVTTFAASLIPVGTTNTLPVVTITSPASGETFASGTTITFAGTAIDAEDGDLSANLAWKMDGTAIGTGAAVTATPAAGTHTVTATVTDFDGASDSDNISIIVSSSGGEIILRVTTRTVRTNKYADLTWSGANSANVEVFRSGVYVVTTANDGAYTDKPSKKITSATYQVCESGTSTCSNAVTVSW